MIREVRSWAWYDFANSSYVLVYQAYLLPLFFSTLGPQRGSLASWAWANALSTAFGVVLGVIVGSYADRTERLAVLRRFVWLSFLGMSVISGVIAFRPSVVPFVFLATNAFFITTLSISDSILPHLARSRADAAIASGYAWGIGYLGGIACMPVVFILQRLYGDYSLPVFGSVAIFYLLFSVVAMRGLRRVGMNSAPQEVDSPPVQISTRARVGVLAGYWLISEAITVIIMFYSIYASTELKLSATMVGVTLLVVQLVAVGATWYGGKLAARFGEMPLLGLSVVVWMVVLFLLVYVPTLAGLVAVVVLTGCVIGNTQSFLRAQFSAFTPKSVSGRDFGVYALVSQAAVIVGPLLYAYGSEELGSQKLPLMALGVAMLVGYVILLLMLRSSRVGAVLMKP